MALCTTHYRLCRVERPLLKDSACLPRPLFHYVVPSRAELPTVVRAVETIIEPRRRSIQSNPIHCFLYTTDYDTSGAKRITELARQVSMAPTKMMDQQLVQAIPMSDVDNGARALRKTRRRMCVNHTVLCHRTLCLPHVSCVV